MSHRVSDLDAFVGTTKVKMGETNSSIMRTGISQPENLRRTGRCVGTDGDRRTI
jgi:hypothetical protein